MSDLLEPRMLLSGSPPTDGITPGDINGQYGIGSISLPYVTDSVDHITGSATGDGTGQTIAIVEAYQNPDLATDVSTFSTAFSLPQFNSGGPTLTLYNEYGGSVLPDSSTETADWAIEEALDVEWAHAIAPQANIDVIEATTETLPDGPTVLPGTSVPDSFASDEVPANDMFTAVRTAAGLPGVSVVSMSWGSNIYASTSIGSDFDSLYDSFFTTPLGHQGVTFVASTGDYGSYQMYFEDPNEGYFVEYPAASPNVLAVGGTYLIVGTSEVGWGNGDDNFGASGGGINSNDVAPPLGQSLVTTPDSSHRALPDVSFNAVNFDTYDEFTGADWFTGAGTSYSAPSWAGLIAIANQGLALNNVGALDGPTQTLPALYNLANNSYSTYYNDITSGNNGIAGTGGYSAGAGYDCVTGLGTPIANELVPALVNTFVPTQLAFALPPQNVTAGQTINSGTGGIQVAVEDEYGDYIYTNDDPITLNYIVGDPLSGQPGSLTVDAVDGVATFSDVAIGYSPDGSYYFTATQDLPVDMVISRSASGALTAAAASSISVGLTVPGASPIAGATIPGLVASIVDTYGNVAKYDDSNISLSLLGDSATLSGTTAVAASSGQAVFSDVAISATGTYYFYAADSTDGIDGTGSDFTIFATLSSGELTVNGTSGNDTISALSDGSGNIVAARNDLTTVPVPATDVSAIDVVGGTGNDTITIDSAVPVTTVQGDSGTDTILTDGANVTYSDTDTVSGSTAGLIVQAQSAGSGTLTFAGVRASGSLVNTYLGSMEIGPSEVVKMIPSSPHTLTTLGSLAIDSASGVSGSLDITDNPVQIAESTSSVLAQVGSWALSGTIWSSLVTGPGAVASRAVGYGDGTEDSGIVSSGYAEVRYVPSGDANLDGTANFTDYTRAVNNFNLSTDYSGGNVLNQSVVDTADITVIVNDYNGTLGTDGSGNVI